MDLGVTGLTSLNAAKTSTLCLLLTPVILGHALLLFPDWNAPGAVVIQLKS